MITGNLKMDITIDNPLKDGQDLRKLRINISDNVKKYKTLSYTTDISTLKLIFKNKTFRSTSLSSAKLNDPTEKERAGIEECAHGRFITCFSHADHEQINMWSMYGNANNPVENVTLVFQNFASSEDHFKECIHTDYVLLNNCSERLYCKSDEYWNAIKRKALPICETAPAGYKLDTCINHIAVFDIEYLPASSDSFHHSYSTQTSLGTSVKDTSKLGFQKINLWDCETETRIMSVFENQEIDSYPYVDLSLKDNIFRGLTIILNPWEEPGLLESVKKCIDKLEVSQDVKDSIVVKSSAVKGEVNLKKTEK